MCFEGLKAGRPRLLKILRIRRSCVSFGTFEDFEEIGRNFASGALRAPFNSMYGPVWAAHVLTLLSILSLGRVAATF